MEIDFIEEQHRDSILKLMEICGINMNEAYQLYVNAGNNFEKAVNLQLGTINQSPPLTQSLPQQTTQPPIIPNLSAFSGFSGVNPYEQGQNDPQYQRYKNYVAFGMPPFSKKYPVRKRETFFKSLCKFLSYQVSKFFRGAEQNHFKTELQTYLQKKIDLNVQVGNLSELLQSVSKDSFPVAVILLNFKAGLSQNIKIIFSDQILVKQRLNVNFNLYGININSYQLEPQLRMFFNYQRDENSIIICRVDFTKEIHVVASIKLDGGVEEIKRKLKLAKSQCIQKDIEQLNMVKQYKEERRGNFNYQRPKSIKEGIKLREDKKLRKQQEEDFFKACLTKNEAKKQNKEVKREEIKPQVQVKEDKPASKEESNESVLKRRATVREALKKYDSGIHFKIRVPSGQNKLVYVDPSENVQYLFDFIESCEDDLGFQYQNNRKFDIFVGFGTTSTLKGSESVRLSQLFQDSQTLIVREILD